jgi:hypothetical protein
MPEKTKQLLLKMMPELEETIDNAFSEYLKLTGNSITKAEYIRRILNQKCKLELDAANSRRKQKENLIINNPKLFSQKLGNELFVQFVRGLTACNKFQSNLHLMLLDREYNQDPISSKRNSLHLFFRIISDIYEFEKTLNTILSLIGKEQKKFNKTFSSIYYSDLSNFRKEINKHALFNKIRNQIGSHDDGEFIKLGLIKINDDNNFVLAEMLSDHMTGGISNSVIYNSANLFFAAFDINETEWKDMMQFSKEIIGKCVDDFQLLFHQAFTEALANDQIYRKNVS